MSAPPPPPPAPGGNAGAFFAGLLLIAVIAPLSQFLTIMTVNADLETASPVGWAVGLVFSLVLVNAAFFALARRRLFAPARLVLIYCMLTIAAPLMNLGLVRHYLLASVMVVREYLFEGTNTYRTAYNGLNPRWFPVVPSPEGLAWARAGLLLDRLQDPEVLRDRERAARDFEAQLAVGGPVDRDLIGRLGPDELARLLSTRAGELAAASLAEPLRHRARETAAAGAAAAAVLSERLAPFDEFVAQRQRDALARLDPSARARLEAELQRLPPSAREAQDAALARFEREFLPLRALVTRLGAGDRAALRAELARKEQARLAELSGAERDAVRHGFVHRLNRSERNALLRQDGSEGPNQNLAAFREGLWPDLHTRPKRDGTSLAENVAAVSAHLPWNLWLAPLAHWGVLVLAIFLFLMCLAEWLRRKWVEREHLAFPLVEVVDAAIRHDTRLELAEDPRHPEPRRRLFYPPFAAGLLIGFVLLSIEALGHYGVVGQAFALEFNVSKEVFSTGPLQEFVGLHFVISPIVVGLLFLVSLEVSFSIWVTYLIYGLVVWLFRISLPALPADPIYTGWAGGRFFPFPMEQLLGAAFAFAAVAVFRTWRAGRAGSAPLASAGPTSLPPRLYRFGLAGLPLLILALLWDLGLTNLPFVLFLAACALALAITAARVRAETGLPTHHTTYEFAKLPLVFGLTGFTGATVYTRFINLAFLPVTLLFRTLPQHLENLELARRHRLPYRTVAAASLAAFVLAVAWGGLCALLYSYYLGDRFTGAMTHPGQGQTNNLLIAHYPLWVSHFLGENGLDKFDRVHGIRLLFIGIGAAVVLALTFLRRRFLRFPLHPIGYLLALLSIFYLWNSPYLRGGALSEAEKVEESYLWGSALVAWAIKGLIVKYGGMNAFKRAKPFFTGLAIGAVFAIFAWNMLDLGCSLLADPAAAPGWMRPFLDRAPYSPRFY